MTSSMIRPIRILGIMTSVGGEATDTLEAIEDEVDELYKIVEGMDYI